MDHFGDYNGVPQINLNFPAWLCGNPKLKKSQKRWIVNSWTGTKNILQTDASNIKIYQIHSNLVVYIYTLLQFSNTSKFETQPFWHDFWSDQNHPGILWEPMNVLPQTSTLVS